MNILSLQLKNFRNYEYLNIDFNAKLIFIIGPNAHGKTNILEAISLLSIGKSFRGVSDQHLIQSNKTYYNIACDYEKQSKIHYLSLGYELKNKSGIRKIKYNKNTLANRQKLIGKLITIIMSPADLNIIEGGSIYRRKFLDLIISYENPEYFQNLLDYNRTVKQRNSLLKKIKFHKANRDDLGYWDKIYVKLAQNLILTRENFIHEFREFLYEAVSSISSNKEIYSLKMQYVQSDEQKMFAECVEKSRLKDINSGFSNLGPQRHSLQFEINGNDILTFGSQGQKRTLVLALRIAQFYYLKKKTGVSPLLLIDDVIRELDSTRRTAFVKLLHNCGQAIFTTPDLDGLDDITGQVDSLIYIIKEPGKVELYTG